MLAVNDIIFINAGKKILNGVSFGVNKQKKIIVGENGSGKTTLLEIITGNIPYDSGTVMAKGTFAYVPQEIKILDVTGMEEMESAFPDIKKIEKKLKELEKNEEYGEEYNKLLLGYEEKGGYTYKHKIYTLMDKIGISEETARRKMREISGGERTKCEIVKVLLTEPSLLIMDEPTNHLDIETIELLEDILKKFKGDLLIVSHDKVFINRIATHILYLSNGKIREYPGNYEKFEVLRDNENKKLAREREKLLKYIDKEQAFIDKFRYGTRSAQAKSRERKLEKIEVPEALEEKRTVKMNLETKIRGGEKVIEIKNLEKNYGSNKVLNGIDISIQRRERVGIIGRNGSGKSTLLKIIAGVEKADSGKVKIGPSITMGYFPQDAFVMNFSSTVISEITDYGYSIPEARDILALFGFTGDTVFKKVGELSGGEKRKLLLTKVSLVRGNFLVLDEPTNHLSIDLKETVLDALKNYNGTILLVTHDRYVLRNTVNKIYRMKNGKLTLDTSKKKKMQTAGNKGRNKEINKLTARISYLEKLLQKDKNAKKEKELKILRNKLKKLSG